ncbi:MAG: NAD-glutamate dehydrogenase [Ilumatobacter coccineus]|uniref:NAD-glutamate dehydrogenase n=1 Tax=Ilumatobacter coccineus TaxID=467094 RepID=A0A2G6KF03_9ACTN|nr:MAG: NAD-glutamate dehydrogenase [Ilumatobacter coccineus]
MSGRDGDQRASLSDQLTELAARRQPDDPVFRQFVACYYDDIPDFDVDKTRLDTRYAAALHHYRLGRHRSRQQAHVEVFTPTLERDSWEAARSFIMVVIDDAPFLIDAIRMVLRRHDVTAHFLVHPILRVTRDDNGVLAGVGDDEAYAETWGKFEIDHCDDALAATLASEISEAVASVHRVVSDFGPMRERIAALSGIDPILAWLTTKNFIFLGAASLTRDSDGWSIVSGSALGQAGVVDAEPRIRDDGPQVQIARSQRVSTIHRPDRMTVITVIGSDGTTAERFVGLFSSSAYRASVFSIPTVGERCEQVLERAQFGEASHRVRAMRVVLETLPRELVFELDLDTLARLVTKIVGLQERQIVRVFAVPEPDQTMVNLLVYLPRTRFGADLPDKIGAALEEAYGSPVRDLESFVDDSDLARITATVKTTREVDLEDLSNRIDKLSASWTGRVRAEAAATLGSEAAAAQLVDRMGQAASAEFRSAVPVAMAVNDLRHLVALLENGDTTSTALVRDDDDPDGIWRMRVYRRGTSIALADLLPFLGYLGLEAIDEHPYRFRSNGDEYYLYDIGVRLPDGVELDDDRHREIQSALNQLLGGTLEADGFNALIVHAGLSARQANVLRSYAKYANQIGFPFSQGYIEDTLIRLPRLATLLVQLFEARFDPDRDEAQREAQQVEVDAQILAQLDQVPSLDDDRIGRMYRSLVKATVRTSAYQRDRDTVAFKFDPSRIPDLPLPRPAHEIFVSSPRVEGVHLRGGAIARGGLRWSDRPEDYRTEVLGLVKAQMVKNAVIIPGGAKGGFVLKQPKSDPAEQRIEGQECYRRFIAALLDLTDNVVGGKVIPPERTVRYDGDDPYLVVAADKGTATFSDLANQMSAEYGFWLGDAFASGGSVGYDHKAMGITARGAWEAARRHASVLGKDADQDELTLVGIGDMSGDVFGNGLLLSEHLKLVAAFDHRHIFLDPNPDPAASHAERRRLFDLPRSSWDDYDRSIVSEGGGIYPRSAKSITLSPQIKAVLDLDADKVTPHELMRAILIAPVDMLWNGGVGTYIKASTETNSMVGDRANDPVRVNGEELRCKMVVEGGNLGATQLGRVEYAMTGGLIYTDAIDNSAGVDCSDHEVNIKILLDSVVTAGGLTRPERNDLLESMTDEVAELVLGNNKAQTLALMMTRKQSLSMADVHSRAIDQLELDGDLDRQLEFLPTAKQIVERQAVETGLKTPEYAVLIAYTKNAAVDALMRGDLPDDPVLRDDLINYFPTPLREPCREAILHHRLRREIVATQVINQMVNLSGISYDQRMTEDTGAGLSDVVAAWVITREVLDFPNWWNQILAVPEITMEDRLQILLECRRTAERSSLWFLRHRRPPFDIAAEIDFFRDAVRSVIAELPNCLIGQARAEVDEVRRERIAQGLPADLAEQVAMWRAVHTVFDIVKLAKRIDVDPVEVARVYWKIFDELDVVWIWNRISELPRDDRWQTQARSSLRDDLLNVLTALTSNVLTHGGETVDAWVEANQRLVERITDQLNEVKLTNTYDITRLSVAVRQLRNLAITSVRPT